MNCCQHCWLLQQGADSAWWEHDQPPADFWDSPGIRLARNVLDAYDDGPYGPSPNARAWAFALEPLGINEHGIHGLNYGEYFVPLVCLGCDFLESYDDGREYGKSWRDCSKFLKLPIRQGYCRMRARHDPSYRLPVEAGTPSTPGEAARPTSGAALPVQRVPAAVPAPPGNVIERSF